MKLTIVGTGYVGLVSGTCFSAMGNDVVCVDVNAEKIDKLQKGIIPIYEPGLEAIITENQALGTLNFTTDLAEALKESRIVFIAVGTPMGEDGSADLTYVTTVARDVGRLMTHPLLIVDKSTVPVGTADIVRSTISEELNKRNSTLTFDVVSNPEFLKEGAAVGDFMKPDRVVVGADNDDSLALMKELYAPFTHNHERFVAMDIRSAEMTKYAANALLATKISFINEMSRICEHVGANVNHVRNGIGSDSRIGYQFIYPGCGYGGSCFPKDVRALMRLAQSFGYTPRIIQAVEDVNDEQKTMIGKQIKERFGEDLSGKSFAVWGLAFKPGTDDMREAPATTIIKSLVAAGATVRAYDPKAVEEAKTCYLKGVDQVSYFDSKYDVLNGADALILVTEWKEFRSPDFDEVAKRLKTAVLFDGRNQYDTQRMASYGFEYHQIGVSPQDKTMRTPQPAS